MARKRTAKTSPGQKTSTEEVGFKELTELRKDLQEYADKQRNLVFATLTFILLAVGVLSYYSYRETVDLIVASGKSEISSATKSAKQGAVEIQEILTGLSDDELSLGGTCFRPHELVLCYHEAVGNHFTWLDQECNASQGYVQHGERYRILVEEPCAPTGAPNPTP